MARDHATGCPGHLRRRGVLVPAGLERIPVPDLPVAFGRRDPSGGAHDTGAARRCRMGTDGGRGAAGDGADVGDGLPRAQALRRGHDDGSGEMRRTRRTGRSVAALAVTAMLVAAGCAAGPSEEQLLDAVAEAPAGDMGLLEGKPYDGTHIRLLSCCKTTAQFAALQEKTDREFTARTGITVEWANIPYESYLQQIVAETAIGGGTYDVVVWPDAYGASAKIGLQPLNRVLKQAGRSIEEFPPPFQEAARAGDDRTIYGLPFRGFSYNYFYRESEFERLGMKPASTWDEFGEQLDRLDGASQRSALAGQYGRNGGQNLYTWLAMLWSNGGEVLDERGDPAFTSPEAVEATERYIDLLRDGHSPPASVNWTETDATQQFEQGASNSVFTWAWQIDDFTDPGKVQPEVADDVGVAPLPGWGDKPSVTYGY